MISPHHLESKLHGPKAVVLLLALAISPLLGAAGSESSFELNTLRIEKMSAAERTRLERNLHTFLEMPETKRNEFRQMSREIEEDTRRHGKLDDVLHDYNRWLGTLSPYQRQEILKETDPIVRAQLVRRMRRERENPPDHPESQPAGPFARRGAGLFGRLVEGRRLPPEDLDAVIKVLERELQPTKEAQKELQSLAPLQRHVRVLKQTLESDRREPNRPGRILWPDETLMKKMLQAISNETVRNRLLLIPEPQRQRQMLGMLIVGALAAEWRPELEKLRPGDEELHEFFIHLDPNQRAELRHLSPEEQQQRLAWQYLTQDRPELRDLLQVFQRLTPRPDRRLIPRNDSRPPNERRGPRGPGRDGAPGDRPPHDSPDNPPPDDPPRDQPPPKGPEKRL